VFLTSASVKVFSTLEVGGAEDTASKVCWKKSKDQCQSKLE